MASKAIKAGLWYTASNFLVRSIGFITMPIFTRIMSQADYGLFNNYQTWVTVFTVLTTMQLGSTMISAKQDYKDSLEQYCLTLVVFEEGVALVWLALANIFSEQFQNLLALDGRLVNMIYIYLALHPSISVFQVWERYRYEYRKTVAVSMTLALCSALLAVVLVALWEDKLFGRVVGQVIPTVVIGTGLTVFFWRKGKRPDLSMLRYALPIALPVVPHALAGVALGSFDKTMITWWRTPEETALYGVAYSCSLIVSVLATSLNQAYSPWLGDKVTAGDSASVRKKTVPYIVIFSIGAMLLMLFAPEVVLILAGENYAESIYAMPPVALGCIFQFLYTLYVNIELRLKKTVGIAIGTVCAAAINVSLNAAFIPTYGFTAAAYTTAIGYGSLLVIHFFIVWRLGYRHYYHTPFIIGVAAGAIVFALAVNSLYGLPLARLSIAITLAIASAVFIIKKRDAIKKFF